MAKKDLENLFKSWVDSGPKKGKSDAEARKELAASPGQVLIVIKSVFSEVLRNTISILKEESDSNNKIINDLWVKYLEALETQESKLLKNIKATKIGKMISGRTKLRLVMGLRDEHRIGKISQSPEKYAFAIATFDQTKKANAALKAIIQQKLKGKVSDREITRLGGVGASKEKQFGMQWGHADAAIGGLSATSLRILKAEQIISKFSNGAFKETAQAKIEELKVSLGVKGDHTQIIDASGGVRKGYVVLVTQQTAWKNQELSKDVEDKAIEDFKKAIDQWGKEDGVVNDEASPSLKTAIGQVLLYNVAGKPLKNKKVEGIAKKKVSNKTSAKTKPITIAKNKIKIPTISGGGVSPKEMKGMVKAPKIKTNNLFSLLTLINAKLPETVAKNMGDPALNNVTGRFAMSVRATDIGVTSQGFPSIGYTYNDIYRTFEVGNKQGSTERDPRRLVDSSIREIASQMAIGRFYTRRV